MNCGGTMNCYVKNVFREQWDDYQLRAVAHGGNENLFKILREYDIGTTNLIQSYDSEPVKWYRKWLMAKMDQVLFVEPKPKTDWKNHFVEAQDKFVESLNKKFEKVEKTDWKDEITQKQDDFVNGLNQRFEKAQNIIGNWFKSDSKKTEKLAISDGGEESQQETTKSSNVSF